MQGDSLLGAVVVDKPAGWTSHDVVAKFRHIAKTKKVGHLGTLDPLATGVLPLVVGRATRLAQFYTGNQKEYLTTIQFGYATNTYDADGAPSSAVVEVQLEAATLEQHLASFRGLLQQVPPAVSAKKIQGRPAYELARKQEAVALAPVAVEVYELELLAASSNEAQVRVRCSAGTYVRSLAHDLGQRLGCGAFVKELRRIRSGDFTIAHARTLEQLAELAQADRLNEALIPGAQLLPEFGAAAVDEETAGRIRQGRDFATSPFYGPATRHVKALDDQGALIAIGEVRLPHLYHPICVL